MRQKHAVIALLVFMVGVSTVGAAYLTITNNGQYNPTPSSTPTVTVSPTTLALYYTEIGKTFTVNVNITSASDLYVWQVGMKFNATLLEALSFEEGSFLKQGGDTLWANGTIDNTAGIIHYHASALAGTVLGVSGNGTLGTVTFKAKDYGNSTLQLTDVILLNSNLEETDKTLVGSNVKIKIPGDVNGDDIVNIIDVSGVSAHWYPGPPIGPSGYDPNADINSDESIDIIDLALVSAYWTGPPKGPKAP